MFRYLKKRREDKKEWLKAWNYYKGMQEFLNDPDRAKLYKAVQFQCQYFALAYLDDRESQIPEISNNAETKFEGFIRKSIARAAAMKDDEYCRSAILDAISTELLCKVGQFERARGLIELIPVDEMRKQTLKRFAEEQRIGQRCPSPGR